MVRDRLFFALLPEGDSIAAIAAAAAALAKAVDLPARWIAPRRWHLTVHFVGDTAAGDEQATSAVRHVLDGARFAAFDFTLDHATSFAGRSPPWVLACSQPPHSLADLAGVLAGRVPSRLPTARLRPDFVPHLTLAHGGASLPAPIPLPPVHWRADRVHLLRSVAGEADYRRCACWPLGD